MVASKKRPKIKRNNVGIPADIDQKLETVCDIRGWTKVKAVERLVDRELELINSEQRQSAAGGEPAHAS